MLLLAFAVLAFEALVFGRFHSSSAGQNSPSLSVSFDISALW